MREGGREGEHPGGGGRAGVGGEDSLPWERYFPQDMLCLVATDSKT